LPDILKLSILIALLKKALSILLIALLLLNLIGYRIVFHFAEKASDTKLEASLDNYEYNDSELITIKVPVSNPYSINQSGFERIDGEINFDGKLYKFVKRRVLNGELILLCIPNHGKMQIEKKKSNYIAENTATEKQDNSKSRIIKNLHLEYDQSCTIHTAYIDQSNNVKINSIFSAILPSVYLPVHGQPPRMI